MSGRSQAVPGLTARHSRRAWTMQSPDPALRPRNRQDSWWALRRAKAGRILKTWTVRSCRRCS